MSNTLNSFAYFIRVLKTMMTTLWSFMCLYPSSLWRLLSKFFESFAIWTSGSRLEFLTLLVSLMGWAEIQKLLYTKVFINVWLVQRLKLKHLDSTFLSVALVRKSKCLNCHWEKSLKNDTIKVVRGGKDI